MLDAVGGRATVPESQGVASADTVGLSSARARALLAELGPNSVPEERPSLTARLADSLWAPVPWMLEATIVLELALGKWVDAMIVAAVLTFNAALGFLQQGRARAALELLRHRLAINARTRRDGAWQLVPAVELVDGDLVHIRVGDLAPADLQIDTGNVSVDQSSLTGESVAVDRGSGETVYAASTIARGEATGKVTATGTRTYFGRTAELVRTAGSTDHLGGVVLRMVRVFIVIDLLLAIAATTYLVLRGAAAVDIASFAVVLLLASVPVALPAAFALAGALGAQHLAGRGILTARLASVTGAAEMDVLCVDKTGTITCNQLAVAAITTRPGISEADVLRLAAGASDEATQDPIDLAILRAAADRGVHVDHRTGFTPFDPATKRSEATLRTDTRSVRVTKGAPQAIAALARQPPDPDVARLGADGARVLAVALTEHGDAWRQVGLLALADAPRPDAAALLASVSELGVSVVMVTGDSAATAAAIAAQVGIAGPIVRADAIRDNRAAPITTGVIAEVLPQDKHHLVKQLQDAGTTSRQARTRSASRSIGFSQKIAFLARAARSMRSACMSVGAQIATASTSLRGEDLVDRRLCRPSPWPGGAAAARVGVGDESHLTVVARRDIAAVDLADPPRADNAEFHAFLPLERRRSAPRRGLQKKNIHSILTWE